MMDLLLVALFVEELKDEDGEHLKECKLFQDNSVFVCLSDVARECFGKFCVEEWIDGILCSFLTVD